MESFVSGSSDPRLTIKPTRPADGDTLTLAVAGELDVHSVSALCDTAVAYVESGVRRLCLDMTEVTFCDNGSLYMLLGLQHALHTANGDLTVTAISNPVERALTTHGLNDLLRL
ncbi:STAS domain-containing protein [Streptomyces rapamycinicus]|nr:STAS domain-containing protein [Streptomyces rapamycinicus]MBB4783905.1 stage II sporulation protein AA (anti-sigma F factor antagonist) [Streptomyces rapamycinicus]UTO64270.1 STAS domain-containing protein [Streptomyces rapamycinicus]UTP32224.1 STAS domain-containing protein [Streptomyces rapamycinicus NRRL 5491]